MHDIYSTLAYSVNGADVEITIIDGKIVMENRTVQNVNEQEIMSECERVKRRLFN